MGGERAWQSRPDVLENARKSRRGYDTDATRASLTAAVKSAFNGNEPRKFQLDIAEALMLGLEVTAIAGTGSRKTLPWVMPLLLEENKGKTVSVISPSMDQVGHLFDIWPACEFIGFIRVHSGGESSS